jgi:hypothetical protein
MARRSDSSGCVRSIGSPLRGTLLKGIPGGPVHLNHVPLGVVEVERERPRWLMDRLIGTPLSMTRWQGVQIRQRRKAVGPGSSRIPADLPVDVMDASRRILIRGMHDN